MVREARQASGDTRGLEDLPDGSLLLVAGEDAATTHAQTCRRLATRTGVSMPFRVCADATLRGRVLGDSEPYGDGAGNHTDLALSEAGLVATESIANFSADGGLEGLHLCVDGLPAPTTEQDTRTLYRFIYTLTRAISRFDSGCHVHLPTDASREPVDTLAPIFDTLVEVDQGQRYRIGAWDDEPGQWQHLTERPRE